MNDHHKEFGYTTAAQQQAARDMYDETAGGELTKPRLGVRLEACVQCRTRPHVEHFDKPTSRPVLWCYACNGPKRHDQVRDDTGRPVYARFACDACRMSRTWGIEDKDARDGR